VPPAPEYDAASFEPAPAGEATAEAAAPVESEAAPADETAATGEEPTP